MCAEAEVDKELDVPNQDLAEDSELQLLGPEPDEVQNLNQTDDKVLNVSKLEECQLHAVAGASKSDDAIQHQFGSRVGGPGKFKTRVSKPLVTLEFASDSQKFGPAIPTLPGPSARSLAEIKSEGNKKRKCGSRVAETERRVYSSSAYQTLYAKYRWWVDKCNGLKLLIGKDDEMLGFAWGAPLCPEAVLPDSEDTVTVVGPRHVCFFCIGKEALAMESFQKQASRGARTASIGAADLPGFRAKKRARHQT